MNTSAIAHPKTPHHCDQCRHWGGWAPIKVGNEVKYDVHGICLDRRHCKTIPDPANGCSLWTQMQKAPNP